MSNANSRLTEIKVSYRKQKPFDMKITCSNDAAGILRSLYNKETIELLEQFYVLYLNRANHIIGYFEMSKGGLTGTIADIRVILGIALKSAATGIILSHNHPSGNLTPSIQDKELTSKISEAARFMDIRILDHLILCSNNKYLSMADEGMM